MIIINKLELHWPSRPDAIWKKILRFESETRALKAPRVWKNQSNDVTQGLLLYSSKATLMLSRQHSSGV